MSLDERLAQVVAGLKRAGLKFLVMGGHAVRHHGVNRTTADFDFQLAGECNDRLPAALSASGLFPSARVEEVATWRSGSFRRFVLGRLPDGREEWLEFWLTNHLLPPYEALNPRAETGLVAGETVRFLSLPDLIRSKETERADDWLDVRLLEEVLDERNLAGEPTAERRRTALAQLRSRRGFERALDAGLLADPGLVGQAAPRAEHPVTLACLRPFLPPAATVSAAGVPPFLWQPLGQVAGGSARHLALVEAVRRHHQQSCMAKDREDKLRIAATR